MKTIPKNMKNIAIAPMLDYTDKYYRLFASQLSNQVELYTEMVVAEALTYSNSDTIHNLLAHFNDVRPKNRTIVQLGSSNPTNLVKAAKLCQQYNYDAINLNLGCPSTRVKSGNFGAVLMKDPNLVLDCIKAMQDHVTIPITVKHRIGLNYEYSFESLYEFIDLLQSNNVTEFIIHARSAILNGLSPKQNREIPPLHYDYVYNIKKSFPHLKITINGGITTISEIKEHLNYVDGVMIGRAFYNNSTLLSHVDSLINNNANQNIIDQNIINANMINNIVTNYVNRLKIATTMIPYLEHMLQHNIPLHYLTRHMANLYFECNNAKLWRHTLNYKIRQDNSIHTYLDLLKIMENVYND